MGMEEDLLLDDEDAEQTIEFLKLYLHQDMKVDFSVVE